MNKSITMKGTIIVSTDVTVFIVSAIEMKGTTITNFLNRNETIENKEKYCTEAERA